MRKAVNQELTKRFNTGYIFRSSEQMVRANKAMLNAFGWSWMRSDGFNKIMKEAKEVYDEDMYRFYKHMFGLA
ncbi:uncharacterized protein PRCAT00004297001 [Priceomyces carsonii]|uniref:uncharacterized protein n=1 Tax=Priceomyces carsonii TaxID=28549 RepID=UPI002EDB3C78|nr:unnamed protein product [Priceomyces carsonii]